VANQLSDDVSVVDVAAKKLIATIAAGDEPNDIAFASGRAFVALGGKEDRVKVFDATSRAQIASLDIFSDTPRALAVNAAGTEVYAIAFQSGNRTTEIFSDVVNSTSNGAPGPPPPNPPRDPSLPSPAPEVGLIVRFNGTKWLDDANQDWSNFVKYTLPDQDVVVISAGGTPTITKTVSGVGTSLYDVQTNPATGLLWVANTDARNLIRFEPNVRGNQVRTRISIVNTATSAVTPIDINPHISYAVTPGPASEIAQSLSQPGDGVFSADGSKFYLTAFGSRKVGVLNASGAVTARIDVGGGPSGVALNEAARRLYVMNRFDNTISIVDTGTNQQIATTGVAGPSKFDPSPDVIKAGRKFLYDAQLTSGHGDIACATCHLFGNFDNLAWDLGDPEGTFLPYSQAPWVHFGPALGPSTNGFDPMKGPMTTQTLRGLKTQEPFHWRGDRQNFQAFNRGFTGLMGMQGYCSVTVSRNCNTGRDCPAGEFCFGISTADMQAYTDFMMTVRFPPNPYRNLDDTMAASLQVPNNTTGSGTVSGDPNNGENIFVNNLLDANVFSCNQCHTLPAGTTRNLFNGNAEGESQDFKIPHLRNMYEKIGFNPLRPGLQSGNPALISGQPVGTPFKRGFGFIHDGAVSLTEFLAAPVFTSTTQQERDLFAFMLSFATETAPAVGKQVTVTSSNKGDSTVVSTINTLIAQANASKCDLIAKGVIGGVAKGYVYDTASAKLTPDSLVEQPVSEPTLRGSLAAGDVLTYTGVPAGAGVRLGIDRDRDGWLDRTEVALGTDPADPRSNPWRWQ
jgi:YVTN family beta-propeller protein